MRATAWYARPKSSLTYRTTLFKSSFVALASAAQDFQRFHALAINLLRMRAKIALNSVVRRFAFVLFARHRSTQAFRCVSRNLATHRDIIALERRRSRTTACQVLSTATAL